MPAVRHVPAACVDPRIKQRSRLNWWIAEQEARQIEPGASALLLDADGFVTETAGANLLIVRDGAVFSPPRDAVLNGVSLRVVEELCKELGIPFEEARLTVEDCRGADEAMLACTSYCLAGVRRVAGADLPWPPHPTLSPQGGEGRVRGIRHRLLDAWGRRVGVEIERQILSNP